MAGGDRGGEHPHQEQHGQTEEGAQGAAAQDQGGGEQMLKNILIYRMSHNWRAYRQKF